jgi:serine/threonine-protein kinase
MPPLPIPEACDLMVQACKALSEAHGLGIVHRDVKPGNMFVVHRSDGSKILKILDFGISKIPKLDGEEEHTLTQSHVLLGSPKYLSPEQVRDAKHVDHRSDVWALGLVLYYMLSGKRPFEGETMSAVCVSIATDTPFRLRALRPEVPVEIDQVVMQCLEKDREYRVQTAADLAAVLAPFSSRPAGVSSDSLAFAPPSQPGHPAAGAALAVMGPISGSADVIELPSPPISALSGVDSGRLSDDSRNVALAVSTSKPTVPVLWLQVGAAAAVAAVLLFVLLGRSKDETSPKQGGVVALTQKAKAAASAKKKASLATATRPKQRKRTVMVPGSAKPQPSVKPDKDFVDVESLLQGGAFGTTQATLRLFSKAGGTQVIGVVPKGEVVMVRTVKGEWALVSFVTGDKAVAGWTLRNLVE